MDWNQGNVYFVCCCFPRKDIQKRYPPTPKENANMQKQTKTSKQAESNDIPLFFCPLLFRFPIFVFFQPYFGSTGAHGIVFTLLEWPDKKKGAFPKGTFCWILAMGKGFCVVLAKELDGVEVDLGVPHQALTKEVPPGLSRYFGPAPRGLGSVLQRDVSILQLPTTLSYRFCCHLERSSFWKFVRICKDDVERETNDATLFLTGIKCGSNRKVMKMIWKVHYSGVII